MSDLQSLIDVGAAALDRLHWDGTGCNVPPDHPSACSHCYGPSPMSAHEVTEAVLAAVAPLIRAEEVRGVHDR